MAGHRLARVVAYDYAADRAVDACIDLDAGVVVDVGFDRSQPMLSREEEALAVSIAMIDERRPQPSSRSATCRSRRSTTGAAPPN